MKDEEVATGDERVAAHNNRRLVYAFLSRVYEKEMTVDLLKELTHGNDLVSQMGSLEGFDEGRFRKGFEMLGGYLRSAAGRDLNQVKLELAVEYANLFLGVRGKPLHPSESVYVSDDHVMYQESRDRVQSIYWEAGVDKKKEYTEPEDHIAIELQFMEYLCRRTVEALEKDDKAETTKYLRTQKDFIELHLARWVPHLTKDVLETAQVDFYKGIAYITDAFIAMDRKTIDEFLDEGGPFSP
jgi:TorA maturation chaperone TorD